MHKELISIIIPAFNCEMSIGKCIDSLISQTYKQLEIIVVNDGSTDATSTVLKKYSKMIKIINKDNSGPSETRNIGLMNANGKFICFVDADDYLDCNAMEISINNFSEEVDVVRFKYKNDKRGKIKRSIFNQNSGVYDAAKIVDELMLNSTFWNTCWGQLIRKDVINGIQFDTTVRIGEDLLFNYRLYKNSRKIKVIDDELYYYVDNNKGITKSINYESITNNLNDVLNCYNYLMNNFEEINNKNKIINRAIQSIVSYERQLLYFSFYKGIIFLKDFNSRHRMQYYLRSYNGYEYKIETFLLKNNQYLFYFYELIMFVPLKILKEKFKFYNLNRLIRKIF